MRVLLSYHYYQKKDLGDLFVMLERSNQEVDIFIDSGAFSAMTLGAHIDLNEYAAWLTYWSKLITTYANLDVIGDPDATLDNQRTLESKGLTPIPVFHTGTPWSYLDYYLESYPYIALGGMVPYAKERQRLMPWLINCFKRAGNRSVYHGLGVTSWYTLSNFPWYSVDSSSWGSGFRYGQVPVFDYRTGKLQQVSLHNRVAWKKLAHLVRALGFNPADFADESRTTRSLCCQLGAASFVAMEQFLRKRHGVIRMPNKDVSGLRTYLSDTYDGNLIDGADGVRIYLAEPSHKLLIDGADGVRIYLTPGGNEADLYPAAEGLRIYTAMGAHERVKFDRIGEEECVQQSV
jgi:hypothetical protein